MSYLPLVIAVWMSLSLAGALEAMDLPAWMISDTVAMPQKIITFTVAFLLLRAYAKNKRKEMGVGD